MMKQPVYLDYNATTPIKPQVLELMKDVLGETGNASSVHGFGRAARKRVETAREQVAALVGVHANQIVFGSGATEANNAVLKTFCGKRVLVSAVEHASVLQALPDAERIPVTADGIVDLAAFEKMLEEGEAPALISVMMVNNETGAIQPVVELAKKAKARHPGVFFHTDAVQAAGRIKIDFPALYVDYMTLSAHKMGGPQGVGALISAPGAVPTKFICGGGQEKRQRAGTENVAGIAAFGLAAVSALEDMAAYQALAPLREKLEKALAASVSGFEIFAQNAPRVSNTCSIGIKDIDAQTVIMGLDLEGIAISGGSACGSGAVAASHVLKAMRPADHFDYAGFRISMGWGSREEDINSFIEAWTKIIKRVKPDQKVQATA